MSKPRLPYDQRPYRLGVGIVLLNPQGEVFVAQRLDTDADAWQMPQGGMDAGEDPRDTAFREMEEEIGTNNAVCIAETEDWITYDLPEDLADKVWKGRFRGQKQKWFLLEFLGNDSDINIDTEHPEFKDWKWATFEHLPDLIISFKRPLYEQVVVAFSAYVRDYRQIRGI